MIEVKNLKKIYGDTTAVDDISFHVPEGEILGFLGPNGAGKTTTMRVLTGFTPATAGKASIGGFDVAKQSRHARSILGYLPENAPVYGEMTVRSYVDFFAEVKGVASSERKTAVGRALDECGLGKVSERLLMNLSKGYRQRAALAQAIVGDPRVLILDEPTVGLDPGQIRDIRSLIRSMAERRTVILSTHILPEVSLTCTRVIIINAGRVVASGTPENIKSNIKRPNRLVLTARGPVGAVRKILNENKHVESARCRSNEETPDAVVEYSVDVRDRVDIRSELSRAIVESGHELLEMRSVGLSLEDVFIHTIASGEIDREERDRHGK